MRGSVGRVALQRSHSPLLRSAGGGFAASISSCCRWLSKPMGSHFGWQVNSPPILVVYCSGWIESDVHWGCDLDFDPWPYWCVLFQGTLEDPDQPSNWWFPLRQSLESLPHSLLSASKKRGISAWFPWKAAKRVPLRKDTNIYRPEPQSFLCIVAYTRGPWEGPPFSSYRQSASIKWGQQGFAPLGPQEGKSKTILRIQIHGSACFIA